MSLFDGLDDDFQVAPRRARPLWVPLAELERGVVEHDFQTTRAALDSVESAVAAAAAAGAGTADTAYSVWGALNLEVAQLAHRVASGEYVAALQGSALCQQLLRGLDADERDAAGAKLDAGSLPDIAAVLRRRCQRIVLHGEGDPLADSPDLPANNNTLAAFRASALVFAGAALLNLFVQDNYSGPELCSDDGEAAGSSLRGTYPPPLLATMLHLSPQPQSFGELPRIAAWRALPAHELERTQWGAAAPAPKEEVAEEEAGAGGATLEALMSAPRPMVLRAALAALAVPDADEVYEHMGHPAFLVAARAVLKALLPEPVLAPPAPAPNGAAPPGAGPGSASAAAVAARLENRRFAKLHEAVAAVASSSWWAGRAALVHQRALVDRRHTSPALWGETVAHFQRAAGVLCPAHAGAFHAGDTFQREVVSREMAETVTRGSDRAAAAEEEAAAGAGTARLGEDCDEDGFPGAEVGGGSGVSAADRVPGASSSTHPAGVASSPAVETTVLSRAPAPHAAPLRVPRVVSRLLLEWGNAQHFFGRTAAAKTSFFLAKRESGLRTQLTGALGRKTKFQTFDTSQLVLRAASGGEEAAGALRDALLAEGFGAADGRFGAAALRKRGLLPPAAGGEGEPSPGPIAHGSVSGELNGSHGAPVKVSIVAAAAGGDEATASAAPASGAPGGDDDDPSGPAPPVTAPVGTAVLGGLRVVSFEDADSETALLEATALRPQQLLGVVTAEDEAHEEASRGRLGWGRDLEARLRDAAAATAAAGSDAVSGGPSNGEVAAAAATSATAAAVSAAEEAAAASVEDGPLSALDQCIVLALCLDVRNHNPADGLTSEEMRPYLERVLDTPLNWMAHSSALLVRSWLEFESGRAPERAVLQLQALLDQHSQRLTPLQASQRALEAGAAATPAARMAFMYALVFPPRWDLKVQVAERYRSMGVLRSSLALYEELELWEPIIEVSILLERNARAERLLRRRLALYPTPRLWCLLGLVTDKEDHYLTAWESSGHSYAKAQLSLAKRAATRGDREAAIAHLRAGLLLTPQSEEDWFLLGMLLMQLSRLGEAVDAFSRVVQLDPTRAAAWANLGSIYVHTGDWARGYTALEQALRIDRRDWRMWSNFLTAAVRSRNYSRAIRVMHTLMDLRRDEHSGGIASGGAGSVAKTLLARKEQQGRMKEPSTEESGLDLPALAVVTAAVVGSLTRASGPTAAPPTVVAGQGSVEVSARSGGGGGGEGGSLLPAAPLSLDVMEEGEDGPAIGGAATGAASPCAEEASPEPAAQLQEREQQALLQEQDTQGNPAAVYADALARLFGRITAAITREPRVWTLYAQLQAARGRAEDALDCRLRAVRALQAVPGWERDTGGVASVCEAGTHLCAAYMALGGPAHATSARLYLEGLLAKVAAAGAQTQHPALAGVRQRLEEVRAAATAGSSVTAARE